MNWALARVFWLNRLPDAPIQPGKVVGSSARHGWLYPLRALRALNPPKPTANTAIPR